MQAASPEDHLPLEAILEVLHDEEFKPPPFFRTPKSMDLDFHMDVVLHEREPRRTRGRAYPPRT
jgi:hypothetical protein